MLEGGLGIVRETPTEHMAEKSFWKSQAYLHDWSNDQKHLSYKTQLENDLDRLRFPLFSFLLSQCGFLCQV